MDTQSRKAEVRSDGSTRLLVFTIIAAAIIFSGISRLMASEIPTGEVTNHRDLTTQHHKLIPNVQKILRTSNSASRIMRPAKLKMK